MVLIISQRKYISFNTTVLKMNIVIQIQNKQKKLETKSKQQSSNKNIKVDSYLKNGNTYINIWGMLKIEFKCLTCM